jgi:xanthosine utilization system XapX-like protein
MTLFSFVLFIHVLSAMAIFVAFAFEGVILLRLRSAETLEQLGFPSSSFRRLGPVYGVAFAGILFGGIYLAASLHLKSPWIPVALLATVVLLGVGGVVTGRRMSRIRRVLAQADTTFAALSPIARSSSLLVSYGFRAGMLVGIVFLMTAMPALLPSLIALTVTTVAGTLLALRFRRVRLKSSSFCPRPAASRS